MRTLVVGLDPSLTSLGISDGTRHELIKTNPGDVGPRVDAIVQAVAVFVAPLVAPDVEIVLVIEAPMLRASTSGSHLYEAGWLYSRIDAWVSASRSRGLAIRYFLVETHVLRKTLFDKGNVPASEFALRIFRKWNVEIANDPKFDKAVAYALFRYGLAITSGGAAHVSAAPRGQGRDARAAVARRGAA